MMELLVEVYVVGMVISCGVSGAWLVVDRFDPQPDDGKFTRNMARIAFLSPLWPLFILAGIAWLWKKCEWSFGRNGEES